MRLYAVFMLCAACTPFDVTFDLNDYPPQTEFEDALIDVGPERQVHSGPHGVHLHTGTSTSPWIGEFTSVDEPKEGYCGPTALKNVLFWYGIDMSYEDAASEMRTGEWQSDDNSQTLAACTAVCGAEPICAGGCYHTLREVLSTMGTRARDAWNAFKRATPEGYRAVYTSDDPSAVNDIIDQILDGNPVVISTYQDALHLAVVTGVMIDPETGWPGFLMANSYYRTLGDFMRFWSLRDAGSSVVLRAGRRRTGIAPFQAFWYEKESE